MISGEVFNQPSCPWSAYELANLVSCEERLCSWVRQPLNTYSNIGLFVVGVLLIIRSFKSLKKTDFDFGVIAIVIGICSTLAHAAQTRFFVFFDYSSQFLLFSYLISFSLHRYRPVRKVWRWWLTLFLICISAGPQIIFKKSGVYIFALMAIVYLCLEWMNLKDKPGVIYSDLYRSLGLFLSAAICFVLDSTYIVCFPQNHFFQFHACWHLLVSGSLYFLAKFYSQFSHLIQETSIRR